MYKTLYHYNKYDYIDLCKASSDIQKGGGNITVEVNIPKPMRKKGISSVSFTINDQLSQRRLLFMAANEIIDSDISVLNDYKKILHFLLAV